MAKTFTIGGYTVDYKGERKIRLANDLKRIKVLESNGNTDIQMGPLPYAMERSEAEAYLANGLAALLAQDEAARAGVATEELVTA
jgi:hypothetical protein